MLEFEFTEEKLPQVAAKILTHLKAGDIVALEGQLAAGKTTLTRALMEKIGYHGRVSSPTFVIEHRYPVRYKTIKEVIHLDLYRLTPKEVEKFDWNEYTNSTRSLVLIEWPDRAATLLPKKAKQITITIVNDRVRHLRFSDNITN